MSETCGAPSPAGGLRCILPPHRGPGGHLWEHPTAGGERKEACGPPTKRKRG